MKAKELLLPLFGLALLGAVAWLWLSPSGVQAVPAVTVTTVDGKKVSTGEFRGHPLLVTFWATTCPGCVAEMPHLVDLKKELGPKGFEILAIAMSYDEPQHVSAMAKERALPYLVARDADGSAARAFGEVRLTPTSFLVDPQGRIVQRKLGEMDMGELRGRIQAMLTPKGPA